MTGRRAAFFSGVRVGLGLVGLLLLLLLLAGDLSSSKFLYVDF